MQLIIEEGQEVAKLHIEKYQKVENHVHREDGQGVSKNVQKVVVVDAKNGAPIPNS